MNDIRIDKIWRMVDAKYYNTQSDVKMKEWIYESPDKGKTWYRRKMGELKKELVEAKKDMEIDDLFMMAIEEKAAEFEVTVDYYMDEFM